MNRMSATVPQFEAGLSHMRGMWLIRSTVRRVEWSRDGERRALDLLDDRYARGEAERDKYLSREGDLQL